LACRTATARRLIGIQIIEADAVYAMHAAEPGCPAFSIG
jgi:hypothetical protein